MVVSTEPAVSATAPRPVRVPWLIWGLSAIVVLGAFTSMLSSTIATVALPGIARDLHVSFAAAQWATTDYLLALAAGVPLSGWAARRLGPSRLWLLSLGLFGAFSVVCATAGTIEVLIAGRVLQGLAGGLLVPAGQTVLGIVAGRERLGRVLSTTGIAIVVAPTLGTTLGSVLVDHLSWPWLFWMALPLCAVAAVSGAAWLPRVNVGPAGPLDRLGLLLVLAGLPLLTYGISAVGTARGLGSGYADAGGGAVLLAAFALRSLRTPTPLLQLRLLTNRVFSCAAAVMFFGGAVNFGAQVVLPLYFLQVRSESLLAAGLLIAPQVLGTALGFPVAGRLTDRHGAGLLLLTGGAITAVATVPLALVGAGTGYRWLGLVLFVRGLGVALDTIPAMTAGLTSVTRDQLADATPLLNVSQRTGATIGTALVAVLYSSRLTGEAGPAQALTAFRWAGWWLFATACLVTLPAVLLTRAERAARAAGPRPAP